MAKRCRKPRPPGGRAGSRVVVLLNDKGAVFQRPHPSQYMDKGALQDVRRFWTMQELCHG